MNKIDRPKLVAKSLGNPKDVVGDKAPTRILLGTVIGVAEKIKEKVAADRAGNSQSFEQIVGSFEGIPAKPLTIDGVVYDRISSGVLYLPDGIHQGLAAALTPATKGAAVSPIRFAIDLFAVKAPGTPGGYGYEAVPVVETVAFDPLADIRKIVTDARAALAAPAAAPAPEHKAKGTKAA